MAVFYGELQERNDTTRLPAVVTVEQGTIRLVSGRTELGEWRLSQVAVSEYTNRSILLRADDAELVLFLKEHTRFLSETVAAQPKAEGRRAPTHPAFRKGEDRDDAVRELAEDVDREVSGIVGEVRHLLGLIEPGPPLWIALGVFFLAVVFAPGWVVALSLVGGVLGLGVGALAYADTGIATKLPGPFTPQLVLGVGGLLTLVGLLVWVLR